MLSFSQYPPRVGGALNHVGLRVRSAEALVAVQRRLEEAGYRTQREDGVECCYARQTKFWVTDPDGVLWETYTVHEDIDHHGAGAPPAAPAVASAQPLDGVWVHSMCDAFPERLPFADAALDEVRLEGSFNALTPLAEMARRLAEVRRVLRPGGRVAVRGLVGDRPFPGDPQLPGVASKVKHIPVETEPVDALAQAGLRGLHIERLRDIQCFEAKGVELRSLLVFGWRAAENGSAERLVRYNGPFAEATDDDGTVYPRGVTVPVRTDTWERLKEGPAALQFSFVE